MDLTKKISPEVGTFPQTRGHYLTVGDPEPLPLYREMGEQESVVDRVPVVPRSNLLHFTKVETTEKDRTKPGVGRVFRGRKMMMSLSVGPLGFSLLDGCRNFDQ